jgi:oxidase EvaA
MVVDVTGDIPVHDHFCWLTLGQIKRLLMVDNLVNMDARTVLSCLAFAQVEQSPAEHADVDQPVAGFAKEAYQSMQGGGFTRHSMDEILSWLTEFKTTYEIAVERMPLNQLRHWVQTRHEIRHETGRYFSVMAVSVKAESREVVSWTQPLLKHTGHGLIGFLVQNLHGTLHVLVRASIEPGNLDTLDMGPTVACSALQEDGPQTDAVLFLDVFLNAAPKYIHYSAVQSEEGGRFYHFQNRYMIVEIPPEPPLDAPDGFIWMTLAQIWALVRHGYFNIEARSLLACLPLCEDERRTRSAFPASVIEAS